MRTNLWLAASLCLLSFFSVSANATEIHPVKGNWYLFDVDPLVAQSGGTEWIDAQVDQSLGYVGDGSPLTFSFSLTTSSFLNIVDAGISGDIFSLSINGSHFTTSTVALDSGLFAGIDFDLAWSTDEFSRLSIFLAPGHYTVTGFLNQSAVDDSGSPFMATVGALQIVEADEPAALLLLSIGIVGLALRRRSVLRAKKMCNEGVSV
jgi:hypothetical protein